MLRQNFVQWGSENSPKMKKCKKILEQAYSKENYHKFNEVDVTQSSLYVPTESTGTA